MITSIRAAVFSALVLVSGALVYAPLSASAQTTPCNWYNNYSTSCGTGTVLVYVQTIGNQSLGAVPSNNTQIQVSGQNAVPSSFSGSQGGTLVSLTGGSGYNVSVSQGQGYTASYSVGCSGIAYANQQATCVITLNASNSFSYPQPYQYPYLNTALTCNPSYQSAPLGQAVSFTAAGGSGVYNWSIPGRSYQGMGQVLNIGFQTTGTQLVSVENGSQVATCTVNITAPGTPAYTYPYNTNYNSTNYGNPSAPALQAMYVPRLPNTGFEPITATGMAFGVIVLAGLGVYLYPYVRKALTIAVR